MTLADLYDTCTRLLNDPRCSPTTPIELYSEHEELSGRPVENGKVVAQIETISDVEPLVCVAISSAHGGRSVVLSTRDQNNAVAR